jgi:hypothetical protein
MAATVVAETTHHVTVMDMISTSALHPEDATVIARVRAHLVAAIVTAMTRLRAVEVPCTVIMADVTAAIVAQTATGAESGSAARIETDGVPARVRKILDTMNDSSSMILALARE